MPGEEIRYGEAIFDASFLSATFTDGRSVRFTRSERALLVRLTGSAGRIVTRDQLLDAIGGAGSDASDRNIDFLISRLRAKLGCSARAPTYIATRYGEGYVWRAVEQADMGRDGDFLVIGPVYGLSGHDGSKAARGFLDALHAALRERVADGRSVRLAGDWRPGISPGGRPRFSLEACFHGDLRLHGALVLRDGATGEILCPVRLHFDGAGALASPGLAETADNLKATMWARLAYGPSAAAAPTDEPLELRLHNAALLLSRTPESWLEAGDQIAAARTRAPDDARLGLMWAMHRYARLVLASGEAPLCDADYARLLDEIEGLVLAALPRIDDNPFLQLAAAKLLMIADRGYDALAEAMAERAFEESTAFASALASIGHMRMLKGETASAMSCYERALELAEPGSEFHVFVLVLICTTQLAAGDRAALRARCEELYGVKPVTRLQLGLVVAGGPDDLDPALAAMLAGLDRERARRTLAYFHYVYAVCFRRPEQRENLMRGIVTLMCGRFGGDVVPADVWRSVPGLARTAAGIAAAG